MDCDRPLEAGAPFIERFEGFVGDTPTTEIVCISCGGGVLAR